ncbi:phosphatidylcholine transfer protein-like [Mizuhopecten yessoensis]|uniref:phosphatidylcholine transfer protein-like n=1 Tax=Mizuhopecten yessoensis TaxID=6573 RepID=UPI000B45B6E6|nr:phosphatidylcholine transfer protein-like [Mizuhopecten yessoensis]
MFQDSDFEEACRELQNPNINEAGYEFFTESSHDGCVARIYRQYNETSGLYKYKVYGTLADVDPEICSEVYMDLEYRRQWDTYVHELYEKEEDGKKLVYWNVNFPFPMSNRDYIYLRELREMESFEGNKIWAVMAKSVPCTSVPEKKGVIRVDDYLQSCVLSTDGKVGSKGEISKFYCNALQLHST